MYQLWINIGMKLQHICETIRKLQFKHNLITALILVECAMHGISVSKK